MTSRTNGGETVTTYEMGDLKVTVEGPGGARPLLSYSPATDEEFDALIDALGGPENFHVSFDGRCVHSNQADAFPGVMVTAPADPNEAPRDRPAIRRLRERIAA